MQIYIDICWYYITNIIISKLIIAKSIGTDDERDPYIQYLVNIDPNGPGTFQSYTMNHEKLSLVRFLDSQYESAGSISSPEISSNGLSNLFNFGGNKQQSQQLPQTESSWKIDDKDKFYKVPKVRVIGRPHNLGWLDLLQTDNDTKLQLG